jgi:putative endonuclease
MDWVYIVECADGTWYTGWTTDPEERVATHNSGAGARYTRSRLPVRLIYKECCADRSQALRRELAIKRLTKKQKQRLVAASVNAE